jgi:uncharacterized membrane protein
MASQEPTRETPTVDVKAFLILLLAAAALAGIVWWNWSVFSEVGFSMPLGGWIALALGTIFSLIVGIGLMFLMFYSSRRGYDETARQIDVDGSGPDGPPSNG